VKPGPPTIRPPEPLDADDRARERRGLIFSGCFVLAVLGALAAASLLGWVAWSVVFWGVARLFGGA